MREVELIKKDLANAQLAGNNEAQDILMREYLQTVRQLMGKEGKKKMTEKEKVALIEKRLDELYKEADLGAFSATAMDADTGLAVSFNMSNCLVSAIAIPRALKEHAERMQNELHLGLDEKFSKPINNLDTSKSQPA